MSRIIRLSSGGIIAGVCQGIGEHLGIDPVLLRILFSISIFGFGLGILCYIILWIILPIDYKGYY